MTAARDILAAAKMTKDIREAVRKELDFDPLVCAGGVTVKNMKRGRGAEGHGEAVLRRLL